MKGLFPCLLAGALCVPLCSPAASPRPNILLVVTDDMGHGDASCNGKTDLRHGKFDQAVREAAAAKQQFLHAP